MQRNPVNSSNISEVGYDSKTKVLEIKFHRGGIFQYHPITEEAYNTFINSKSLGKWFYENIKNNNLVTTTPIT